MVFETQAEVGPLPLLTNYENHESLSWCLVSWCICLTYSITYEPKS